MTIKGRLARGASKKSRSIQYSTRHRTIAAGIAEYAQRLPAAMLHTKTMPARSQPAPVMDKYSGLRLAWNSLSTSRHPSAANRRRKPKPDRLNTIQRSRVTPNGRFLVMEFFQSRNPHPAGRDRSSIMVGPWNGNVRDFFPHNARPSIPYRHCIVHGRAGYPEDRCSP